MQWKMEPFCKSGKISKNKKVCLHNSTEKCHWNLVLKAAMEHGGEYAISVYNYKGSAYRTCHVIVEHAMRPPAMPDLLSSCDEYCSRSDLYLSDDTDTERSFRPTYVKQEFNIHFIDSLFI